MAFKTPPSLPAAGLAMFVSGLVLWQVEGTSAFIALLVLGSLVFIPGFYFTRIAYKAYKGHRGYSWDDVRPPGGTPPALAAAYQAPALPAADPAAACLLQIPEFPQ